MFDSAEELLEKIRLGEDTLLELKTVRFRGGRVEGPRREDMADELAAFANARGGALVLGVDDKTRDIVGIPIERLDTVERWVSEICNDGIAPALPFLSFRLRLPDGMGDWRAVFKVEIPRSFFVHSSFGRYFYRPRSSKREMPPEYLARLFQQRSQARVIRFEEQPVPQSGMGDLLEKLWSAYITRSDEPAEVVLLKRGLLAKEESGTTRASVAGVLFCCEAPERFLSKAYIEAVRYRGKRQDSNYQMDAQRIFGPLPRQIEQAMAFLKRNQTVAAVKIPHHVERPQFSERAVFEALVNAVAHRDYSVSGSKIRFFMFDDRLEIYSPGALANTLTVDNMALRQSTRNELIASLLAKTPVAETVRDVERRFYMEERGDGVPAILRESEQLSGKKPVYRLIDDAELLLTIYAASVERVN